MADEAAARSVRAIEKQRQVRRKGRAVVLRDQQAEAELFDQVEELLGVTFMKRRGDVHGFVRSMTRTGGISRSLWHPLTKCAIGGRRLQFSENHPTRMQEQIMETTKPTVHMPGQGRTIAVVGDVYRFLATGEE